MKARSIRLAALAASALLSSGCTLSGTVVIASPEKVSVDLTYTPERSPDRGGPGVAGCLLDSTMGSLNLIRQRNPDGTTVCRITGETTLAELQRHSGLARHIGNQVQVEFFPGGRVPDSVAAYQAGLFTHLDVSVTFPGTIIDHLGGRVTGSTVRFDDRVEFVAHRGLAASSWDSTDVEARAYREWLVLVALVAGAGLLGFLVGGRDGRRRRTALLAVHRRTLAELDRLRAIAGEAAGPSASGPPGEASGRSDKGSGRSGEADEDDPWSHD